ncbi:clamp-binding protein CrfC [Desulfosporosinus acididurans]|uniref:Clamp-binding protein CrfC n=1 Tax=Desulfosporosinus acididurans TaxID=476652 RepID=A0A0J1FK23_9FIRM|nr:dynamin family protein [Desulfosporosinus acididurans]KLU63782.1 clamp-binding protein CrfC [Desulfosporosinus acididurans]
MNNTEKIKELLHLTEKLIDALKTEDFWKVVQTGEILEGLQSTYQKLKSKNYSVAVIAAMKAGKSTLFNALLGKDILPNETAACTTAITEIRFSKKPLNKVLKYLKDGTVQTITEGNGRTLEQNFHKDVRDSRHQNGVTVINKYYMEFPIVALNNEEYKDLVENFLLIDTPGPNEAGTGQFDTQKLREITYYQLRNADAIIFVFDYCVYKSDTNANLIKEIFAGREDIIKDNDKIFFVVNKVDMRSSKDGSKEQVIQAVKEMISFQTQNTLSNPQVLPFSALMALYGREIENGTITEEALTDCKNKYQARFSEEVIINGKKYLEQLEAKDFAPRLLKESDIYTLEEKVILDTFKKASAKLIEGAIENIDQKSTFMLKTIDSQIKIQSKGIEELRDGITKSKHEIQELYQLSDTIMSDTERYVQQLHDTLNGMIFNISTEITMAIEQQLGGYQNVYKSEDRNYLSHLTAQIERDCNTTVSTYCFRKQDEIIRKYNEARYELIKNVYQEFRLLTQRADAIIKKHLDIEIDSEGLMSLDIGDMDVESVDISSSRNERNKQVSDSNFKDQTARGITTAAEGATIGMAIAGPVGALVGGIAGFLLGVGTHQDKYAMPEQRTVYTLDVTVMKANIKRETTSKAKILEDQFRQQTTKEMEAIKKAITKNVGEFINSVNGYLDGLEKEFEEKRSERESYIQYLKTLEGKMMSITAQLQHIK